METPDPDLTARTRARRPLHAAHRRPSRFAQTSWLPAITVAALVLSAFLLSIPGAAPV